MLIGWISQLLISPEVRPCLCSIRTVIDTSDRLQRHEYGDTLFQDECLSHWVLLTPTSPFITFGSFQVFLDPLQTVIIAQNENAVTS
ncbi:hypothetical protein F2Q68_00034891 [Brassica cretica]|uniref:Uncharacterized protein n=1 Tax=Brassica cretica TaxID=69181 RepID=A0A8S9H7L2_BRACR|nr:hypothetical protein F2Q68_00034891 [Brassica cretica]